MMDSLTDNIITCIIKQFSEDYPVECPLKELHKRYIVVPVPEPIALSKMKKTDLVQECARLNLPSTGSVIELKRIIKKYRTSTGVKTSRGNKRKNIKKIIPLHTHELCIEICEECPLCQSHGNVMNLTEVEYEMIL